MRKLISILLTAVIVLGMCASASACTMLYVGGDLTDDGANMFVRVEDYYDNDFNKVYYVSPAGNHAEGELYEGCYGFSWTFTHDSYQYTARRDDNLSGVCPDCGGTHAHTPYEEAGVNEHGVTVSATETLYANEAVLAADPYTDEGIEEAEIVTIILSEAASAREGVELLLSIYDSVGANAGAGLMIADQNEQWYVENLSGHQYLAVLMPPSVAFLEPNLSVLGRIDLDDADNVIASADLIALAQQAETFVGEADDNVIDFHMSYASLVLDEKSLNRRTRLANGLNFLTGSDAWTPDNVMETNAAIMSNIAEDGSITALHNELVLKPGWSIDDVFALYRVYPIGFEENEEIHLYRYYPDAPLPLGTVEWSTMDDLRYNVYVPSYPILLTDTWDGFKVSVGEIAVQETQPEAGDFYVKDGEYYVYPEGWEASYFWTMNALSNALTYGDHGDEAIALAQQNFALLQESFKARFDEISQQLAAEESAEAQQAIVTEAAVDMSKQAHDLALALYNYIVKGEASELIQLAG